jgi:hypothetical protein
MFDGNVIAATPTMTHTSPASIVEVSVSPRERMAMPTPMGTR